MFRNSLVKFSLCAATLLFNENVLADPTRQQMDLFFDEMVTHFRALPAPDQATFVSQDLFADEDHLTQYTQYVAEPGESAEESGFLSRYTKLDRDFVRRNFVATWASAITLEALSYQPYSEREYRFNSINPLALALQCGRVDVADILAPAITDINSPDYIHQGYRSPQSLTAIGSSLYFSEARDFDGVVDAYNWLAQHDYTFTTEPLSVQGYFHYQLSPFELGEAYGSGTREEAAILRGRLLGFFPEVIGAAPKLSVVYKLMHKTGNPEQDEENTRRATPIQTELCNLGIFGRSAWNFSEKTVSRAQEAYASYEANRAELGDLQQSNQHMKEELGRKIAAMKGKSLEIEPEGSGA